MTEPITEKHIVAIHRLNYWLGEFVRKGLINKTNPETDIKLLMAAIAQHSMDQLDSMLRFRSNTLRKKSSATELSEPQHAYQLYAKFVSKHHIAAVANTQPALLGELPQSQQELIISGLGKSFKDLPLITVLDEVAEAWYKACHNGYLTYQRLGVLSYLISQLPSQTCNKLAPTVQAEIEKAHRVLYRNASDFFETEMRFALLLGGEALKLTKAKLIATSFAPNMSIMQYLQENEHLPSRYLSKDEESFRAAIRKYTDSN